MRRDLLTNHERLLRLEKNTVVRLMNHDPQPTFEAARARTEVVLSDNGREFCGRHGRRRYELFLQLEEIEHRTTRVKRPQSNGIVERLHRMLLDEHFRVERRRTRLEDRPDNEPFAMNEPDRAGAPGDEAPAEITDPEDVPTEDKEEPNRFESSTLSDAQWRISAPGTAAKVPYIKFISMTDATNASRHAMRRPSPPRGW